MKTKKEKVVKEIETAEVPEKKKRIRTPAKKEHYVNNKEFLIAMVEYKDKCNKAEARGRKKPPVTNYIGECFLKIANHLSYRPNFINYTFRDDMISDGIENCLQYLGNFNPEKSNNPFAYFTQIIYYAFIRRIQKEKKQTTIKHKLIMDANYDDMTLQPGEDRDFKNQFTEFLQKNLPNQETTSEPIEVKPKGAKLKRTRKAKINLENF
jgi:hypothetical protein|tara:strand:+ start:37236 stop:37862 length:627 start_codon:yes stop_codon:yes gene_type:complete